MDNAHQQILLLSRMQQQFITPVCLPVWGMGCRIDVRYMQRYKQHLRIETAAALCFDHAGNQVLVYPCLVLSSVPASTARLAAGTFGNKPDVPAAVVHLRPPPTLLLPVAYRCRCPPSCLPCHRHRCNHLQQHRNGMHCTLSCLSALQKL